MADLVFKVHSTDEEQRLVFGLASLAVTADGQVITDLQSDQILPADLEKAFYDLVAEGNIGGDVNHDHNDRTVLVECFVVTPEKLDHLLKACGYQGQPIEFKGAAAWVGYRVGDPETWQAVKSGKLTGFSIEGAADRVAA